MDYSPIWISLKTAGATILVVFFVGLAVAKAVASLRKEKLKMILDGILTLPLVLPPTVAADSPLRLPYPPALLHILPRLWKG